MRWVKSDRLSHRLRNPNPVECETYVRQAVPSAAQRVGREVMLFVVDRHLRRRNAL